MSTVDVSRYVVSQTPITLLARSFKLMQINPLPLKSSYVVRTLRASQSQSQSYGESLSTSSIASLLKKRRPQNVGGDFFVDHTCIDCDTCRWMAPEVFTQVDDMSAVYKQPSCSQERLKALQGVFHCGYHSEKSYGAASYLIVQPEGNILVDRDDVADHKKWSERLSCDRILHAKEVEFSTADVEVKLEGSGPWSLGDDIELIHTPGHTAGSVCLLYKSGKVLFTGDHLGMDESGSLSIMETYNWYSVPMQLNSVRMLLELDFEWILPGHGRKVGFADMEDKNSALEAFLAASRT